jgi:ATP-dependent DNA helicase RecQ
MEQHSRICLISDSREVLKGERKVQLRHDPTPEKKSTKVRSLKVRTSKTAPSGMDSDLFEVLRKERATLARELDIPPYMIASDRSLQDMAMLKPRDEVDLLAVYGFGEAKVERFGQIFLSALRPWL